MILRRPQPRCFVPPAQDSNPFGLTCEAFFSGAPPEDVPRSAGGVPGVVAEGPPQAVPPRLRHARGAPTCTDQQTGEEIAAG